MSDLDRSTTSPSFPEDLFCQDLNDVFTLLKPVNPSAHKAFHDAVVTVIEHLDRYGHVALSVSNRRELLACVRKTKIRHGQKHQWTGTFVFSPRTRPRNSGEAWVLGTGRGLSADHELDITLAPRSQRRSAGIAGRHALFFFHQDSGRIVLQARHAIQISRTGTTEWITTSAVSGRRQSAYSKQAISSALVIASTPSSGILCLQAARNGEFIRRDKPLQIRYLYSVHFTGRFLQGPRHPHDDKRNHAS
ncbi:hypothetical protein MMC07_008102 [Pseudocyphellaria aurata]|nr:hypothetical protein [Pseudocyphellaria aurata]